MPRTFAIGDIHGCLSLLKTLLAHIQPTQDDTLIFLGDMVDRGEDSKGVLDCVMMLEKQCHVIVIKGNHEEMMLGSMSDTETAKFWLRYGGAEAMQSFGLQPSLEQIKHIPFKYKCWLESLRNYYETVDFIFCHATPKADISMDTQGDEGLRWRKLRKADGRHISGKTIICGHSEQRNGQVKQQEGIICIDTFAYGCGVLTALEVETLTAWQAQSDGRCLKTLLNLF
ncbi:metallophosphoesterase family protein [Psychrobacter sp. I-STPA10]|uniref:metallophosphoesterase family protein n=1 Tax=Psychrobacter sp. I-STPA10 TaxID=2585769 RepID=UPI001E4EAB82|nr:metallophosphoesterase family protein [Psychrobacter sp. I-STPA10]